MRRPDDVTMNKGKLTQEIKVRRGVETHGAREQVDTEGREPKVNDTTP